MRAFITLLFLFTCFQAHGSELSLLSASQDEPARDPAVVLNFADINATFASSPGNALRYAMTGTKLPRPDNTTNWYLVLSDSGRPSRWSVGVSTGFEEGEAQFQLLTYTWEEPTDPNCRRLKQTAVVACRAAATLVSEHHYNFSLRIDHNVLEAYVSVVETGEDTRIGRVALEPDGVEVGPFPNFVRFGALAVVVDFDGNDDTACKAVSLPLEVFVSNPIGQSGVAATEPVDLRPCSDEIETVLQKQSDGTKMQFKKRV